MAISLDLVRSHLRFLPGELVEENAILEHYARVSEAWITAYIGGPFDDQDPLQVQAALMLIGHQFENREGVVFSNPYALPWGVRELLSPRKARITGYVAPVEEAE